MLVWDRRGGGMGGEVLFAPSIVGVFWVHDGAKFGNVRGKCGATCVNLVDQVWRLEFCLFLKKGNI